MKESKNYDFSAKKPNLKVKTLRVPTTINDYISYIIKKENISESEYIRSLIDKDIRSRRLKIALRAYERGEVSSGKGAEIADIPRRVFLEKLEDAGIGYMDLDPKYFEYGMKCLEEALGKKKISKKKSKK